MLDEDSNRSKLGCTMKFRWLFGIWIISLVVWHLNIFVGCLVFVEYVYRSSHPMLQFLPQKLAEWIANNYAEELNVPLRPDLSQPWSTATLNRILQTCLVSDRKVINIYTFQTVEFESDLYSGVMHTGCYKFNMERHLIQGRNVKVCTYTWYM